MKPLLLLLLLAPRAAEAKNLRQDPVLFHSGARAHMDTDIREGNVPLKAWNEFIMGKTNFDLPDYRKGLYGAEALAGTGLYSLYRALSGGEPWVMVVKVKKECLEGNALYSEEYNLSAKKEAKGRFHRWYHRNRAKYRHLEKDCWHESKEEFGYWETGALYSLNEADAETKRLTLLCTPVLKDFLDADGVKVFFDAVNDDSWGIRDRSCIEEITGTPDQLLTRILENRIGDPGESFIENFYGSYGKPGLYYGGNTVLFLGVAAETTALTPGTAPALERLAKELRTWVGPELKKEAELSLDANGDNPQLLLLAAEKLARVSRSGDPKAFQLSLKAWLAASRAALGKACDGAKGVKPERREACAAETEAQTASLLALLR